MFLKDQAGTEIQVDEGNAVQPGDRVVVLRNTRDAFVVGDRSGKHILFTVREVFEQGNRVRLVEMGGSWFISTVFKVVRTS